MQPNRKTRYFHTFECKNPLLLYLLYNVERRNKGKLQCTDENFMRICKILAPILQDIKQKFNFAYSNSHCYCTDIFEIFQIDKIYLQNILLGQEQKYCQIFDS